MLFQMSKSRKYHDEAYFHNFSFITIKYFLEGSLLKELKTEYRKYKNIENI